MFLQLSCSERHSMFPLTPVVYHGGPGCVFWRRITTLVSGVCFLRVLVLDAQKMGDSVQRSELAAL